MDLKKYCFLILATISITVCAQAQTLIKGKVSDEKGEAVIGANVLVRGTSNGTVTDIEGNFQLQLPAGSEDATLTISSIGYVSQEIAIAGQTTFNVTMAEDLKVLNEVVVTGYTSQRKDKITGAVAIVKGDELIKLPVPSLDQALQGRAPGVVVSQNTGAPGEGVQVRIRGVGSILSGNGPLYIVDGLPTQDISQISTQDIESMTILRDASAAAVYGARAANGVVVVTTKAGSAQAMQVQVNSQIGFQEPSRKIKMANTDQYVSIYNEAISADNATKTNPIFMKKLITDEIAAGLANTDWVDAIMRKGILQNHSVSVSGGNDKTRYFVAGNYFGQQGIVKSSDYERLSGRVNVESDVKSWLKAGVNLNLSRATTDLVGSSGDGAGGNGGSVIRYAYFRTPAIPVYDDNGNFTDKPERFDLFGDGYNPVGMLAYNQNRKKEDRVFGKFYLNIEPIKDVHFITNFGIDISNYNRRRFDRTWGTDNRINGINRLETVTGRNQTITWSNFLSYTKTFGQSTFNFLLGEETVKNSVYALNASQTNFPDQDQSLVYLGNGLGLITNSENQQGAALASFFGKVDYDFANKYLISGTVRRDGSSKFGPENRWGTFYAGSLGWRIDQEFFKESNIVERWLFRAGYGSIGNQDILNYGYTSQIGLAAYYPYGNTRSLGSSISTYGNTAIKWETSNQFNLGTDIELWAGKLNVSFDYYRKLAKNLLLPQPLAASVGLNASTTTNNGELLNTGFELAISHSNQIGAFKYSVTANGATLKNEVLSMVSGPIAAGNAGGGYYITLTEPGQPVGSFYMLEMEGIFQNDLQVFTHAIQGKQGSIKPGDVMYKDQDKNGVIDENDRVHVGSAIPKFTAGLNVSMSYKAFDLSLFFQGAYGQKVFSTLNRDIEGFYRPFNVTERYFENHWTGEGTTNKYPRASWDASQNNNRYTTRFLENGSYTRLKNLQVGFNVPKDFISRYGFSAFRIYVSGTNLLTFTKFQGSDPEMTVSDNAKTTAGDLANGIDWGTYPAARSYNVGVSVTF